MGILERGWGVGACGGFIRVDNIVVLVLVRSS